MQLPVMCLGHPNSTNINSKITGIATLIRYTAGIAGLYPTATVAPSSQNASDPNSALSAAVADSIVDRLKDINGDIDTLLFSEKGQLSSDEDVGKVLDEKLEYEWAAALGIFSTALIFLLLLVDLVLP